MEEHLLYLPQASFQPWDRPGPVPALLLSSPHGIHEAAGILTGEGSHAFLGPGHQVDQDAELDQDVFLGVSQLESHLPVAEEALPLHEPAGDVAHPVTARQDILRGHGKEVPHEEIVEEEALFAGGAWPLFQEDIEPILGPGETAKKGPGPAGPLAQGIWSRGVPGCSHV